MQMIKLYHGTNKSRGQQIQKEGFKSLESGIKANWQVRSKEQFVYLSDAYAPFFAMMNREGENTGVLIKVEVDIDNLYPDDDWLMAEVFEKPRYSQKEINDIDLEKYKELALLSLIRLGSVCTKPEYIKIIGFKEFDMRRLVVISDPVICVTNYLVMGNYYKWLSDELYKGVTVEQLIERNSLQKHFERMERKL